MNVLVKKKSFIFVIGIVLITTILSRWFGWYATSVGVALLGAWFGIELWKITELDTKILLLILSEVILIWLAFSLAYYELTFSLSDSFSISVQNLLHFNFMNVSDTIADSNIYRILSAIQGLVGYLLIVSGVAQLITKKTPQKIPQEIQTSSSTKKRSKVSKKK